MGWFSDVVDRVSGRDASVPAPEPAARYEAPPTPEEILASVAAVRARAALAAPSVVTARVARIAERVEEMVPRLDRMGLASREAYTVVATATSYLPESVDAYLRLPRDFADREVIAQGRTALALLCDQLDLLTLTLGRISDALSRQDAVALVAQGTFLEETFASGSVLA